MEMNKISWPGFRRSIFYATTFMLSSFVIFIFIYWQVYEDEIERITLLLELQGAALSTSILQDVGLQPGDRQYNETYRLTASGLFEAGGAYLQGNLREFPKDLPIDGKAHLIENAMLDPFNRSQAQTAILVANRLSDGRTLVIARNALELVNLQETIFKTLLRGVLPLFLLSVVVSAIFAQRTKRRLKMAQRCLSQIKDGHLHYRLPLSSDIDELDQLAIAVNDMLSELERAVYELQHIGNNIAHGLRTPLARARAYLEQAEGTVRIPKDGQELIERAITSIDQTITITTAMLRLVELEAGPNRKSFEKIGLSNLLLEVAELYEPLAESKNITIGIDAQSQAYIIGDKDLLLEAIANIIDNSIKFTPEGGCINLRIAASEQGPIIEISDTGPGIPAAQREDVFKRFYRCGQTRDIPGTGLGLTLVAAIVKLHQFHVAIGDPATGCIVEIRCFARST